MMDGIKEDSGKACTLRLEGELGIQRASELKKILLEAQGGSKNLILNLEGVTGTDVSGLQLLCEIGRASW